MWTQLIMLIKNIIFFHCSWSDKYIKKNSTNIGSKYKKAVFLEYTDDTFTVKKPRPVSEKYLGTLGPLIKVNIGSNVTVVFKNLASRPYSLHGFGLNYNKDSEGFAYDDSIGEIIENVSLSS